MPATVTVLLVPTFLSAKLAVARLSVRTSPETRLSDRVGVATTVPSYVLLTPAALTTRPHGVMLATVEALRSQGHEVAGCGVVLGSGKALPGLETVLGSHALIHTAEGEMFRDVLVWAAKQCRLPVIGVREKDLDAASLSRVGSLGKLIGPPWTQDQKYATVAALMAL